MGANKSDAQKRVFVVMSGEYSSRGIEAIFKTRAEANQYKKWLETKTDEWGPVWVDLYIVGETCTAHQRGLLPFEVVFDENDKTHRIRKGSQIRGWPLSRTVNNEIYVSANARDEKHAVKIASDRRRIFLATEKGIA